MTGITSEEVRAMARLARIHLDEAEVEAMRGQLTRILEAFSRLQAHPGPAGGEPAGPAAEGHLRSDTPGSSLPRQEALDQAPDAAEGHVRIPRVL